MLLSGRVLATWAGVLLASPVAIAQYGGAAVAALNSDDAAIVVGQPFTLVEKTADLTPKPDGTAVTRRSVERKWRDSQGRFRREVGQVADGQEAVYDRATIIDPVKNTVTTLYFDRKVASVVHLQPGALHPYVDLEDRPLVAMPGVQVKVETIEGRSFAGEKAVGRRVTRTRPPGTVGNDKTIVSVSERWMSPDLKIMLATSMDDPREKQGREVMQISRGEPDASLFQVPADYTVTEAVGRPMHEVVQSNSPR
jgi:hypothetical protein